MSTIKCTTIQNLSGVEVYTAKAWVNFSGTGTVAIRAAGNVSSITDIGIGIYRVNFTNAMVDTNYVCSIANGLNNVSNTMGNTCSNFTANSFVIDHWENTGRYDIDTVLVSVIR